MHDYPLSELLTVAEVARRADVHVATVWTALSSGRLPSVFVLGRRLVHKDDLPRFIASISVEMKRPRRRAS
jgi:excisionase family DNA binding protein